MEDLLIIKTKFKRTKILPYLVSQYWLLYPITFEQCYHAHFEHQWKEELFHPKYKKVSCFKKNKISCKYEMIIN